MLVAGCWLRVMVSNMYEMLQLLQLSPLLALNVMGITDLEVELNKHNNSFTWFSVLIHFIVP
jgi:hypothetical protein